MKDKIWEADDHDWFDVGRRYQGVVVYEKESLIA